MALDAIFACNLICDHGSENKIAQNEVLEILKARTNGAFKDGGLSYSTMSLIISQLFRICPP